jgi:hypothetical protein
MRSFKSSEFEKGLIEAIGTVSHCDGLDIITGHKISLMILDIEKYANAYNDGKMKLVESCSLKDDKGKIVFDDNGEPCIDPEHSDRLEEDLKKLREIENEIHQHVTIRIDELKIAQDKGRSVPTPFAMSRTACIIDYVG